MYGMQCDICKKHLKTEENIIAFMRKQDIGEMAESMGWDIWHNGTSEYHYCPKCKRHLEENIATAYEPSTTL